MPKQSTKSSTSRNTHAPDGLHEFLSEYKKLLRAHVSEIKEGQNLLKLGAKTAAIQNLEQWVTNPVDGLLSIQKNAEDALKKAVEQLVRIFLKSSIGNGTIRHAFLISETNNSLSYGVVLHEDNFRNRNKVFKFLSLYYTFELSERIPVHFQFIPEELRSTFDKAQYIS
jgi:hypothetical protein